MSKSIIATGRCPMVKTFPLILLRAANKSTKKVGGGERVRTDDLLLAKQMLSQLSYAPMSED